VSGKDPLVKEIYIEARRELVFEHLTEPARLLRWMGLAADLDAQPGGIFRIDPNGRDVIRGTFLEVIPHRRIVFTWGWEEDGARVPAGSTTVEIDLEEKGSGTLVRLTHRGLPDDALPNHELGWTHYLSRLKIAVEGGEPGADKYATPSTKHG
jgi:uncharacterized protein YndB with AHSA1/START domain